MNGRTLVIPPVCLFVLGLILSWKYTDGCMTTPTDDDDDETTTTTTTTTTTASTTTTTTTTCKTCASVLDTDQCVTDGFYDYNCFGFASETPVTPPAGVCSAVEVTCNDAGRQLHVVLSSGADKMFAGDATETFYCHSDGTTQLADGSVIAESYCSTDCDPTMLYC